MGCTVCVCHFGKMHFHGPLYNYGPIPPMAGCNACHNKSGAVENTFVQFYPTLLEVAQAKGTLKKTAE